MSNEDSASANEAPKKTKAAKKSTKVKKAKATKANASNSSVAKFPRHPVEKALRIPKAIIEQNAGKESSENDAARYAELGKGGPTKVEISSAIKYGFLTRPRAGYLAVTNRARQAIRPQKPGEEIDALRQAILEAPEISEVYKHYRGEDLPDMALPTGIEPVFQP